MSPASHFPRATNKVQGSDLGDEFLFYDSSGDEVHVLNGTAREIYLLCDGSRSAEDVASILVERYDIDAETALADARQIIARLERLGLIEA